VKWKISSRGIVRNMTINQLEGGNDGVNTIGYVVQDQSRRYQGTAIVKAIKKHVSVLNLEVLKE